MLLPLAGLDDQRPQRSLDLPMRIISPPPTRQGHIKALVEECRSHPLHWPFLMHFHAEFCEINFDLPKAMSVDEVQEEMELHKRRDPRGAYKQPALLPATVSMPASSGLVVVREAG